MTLTSLLCNLHHMKDDAEVAAIGREMKRNPPAALSRTRRKFGSARAEKQRRAILLSKARKRGVKVPASPKSPSSGSLSKRR